MSAFDQWTCSNCKMQTMILLKDCEHCNLPRELCDAAIFQQQFSYSPQSIQSSKQNESESIVQSPHQEADDHPNDEPVISSNIGNHTDEGNENDNDDIEPHEGIHPITIDKFDHEDEEDGTAEGCTDKVAGNTFDAPNTFDIDELSAPNFSDSDNGDWGTDDPEMMEYDLQTAVAESMKPRQVLLEEHQNLLTSEGNSSSGRPSLIPRESRAWICQDCHCMNSFVIYVSLQISYILHFLRIRFDYQFVVFSVWC